MVKRLGGGKVDIVADQVHQLEGAHPEPAQLAHAIDTDIKRWTAVAKKAGVKAIVDDAVRIANDTPFGLGSYVYTTDPEQALRVADGIEAGMVFVNVVLADGAELPFGGIKRSGSGRELGRFGADEFANKKMIRIG